MAGHDRREVVFQSAGTACVADLYRPAGGSGEQVPCVVMAHGFTGTRNDLLPAYAERFAAAGLAALVFDYRHFGDSAGEPRQLLDIRRQLADWRAAIACARTLTGVDPDRIALWGTSFSGGHVVTVAASDPRIAAVVAQVPFADGLAAALAVPPRTGSRLVLAGLRDAVGGALGRPARLLPAVGRPGAVAAMTAPGAEAGLLALAGPGTRWQNAFSARLMLTLPFYRPVRSAHRLRMPLLVCVAEKDTITPPAAAVRMAHRAPQGSLVSYPIGHFDIYVGDAFETAVTEQVDFLRRHLLPESPGS